MKIIAFKRAGDHPSLHPEFITEFIDASLLPSTEGYETMIEEHFNLEYAKNDSRHSQKLKELSDQHEAYRKAQEAEATHALKVDKEMQREFEMFKAWQKSQRK